MKTLGLFLFICTITPALGKSTLQLRGVVPQIYNLKVNANSPIPTIQVESNTQQKAATKTKLEMKKVGTKYLVSFIHP